MSFSNWLHNFPLRECLIAATLFPLSSFAQDQQGRQPESAASTQNQQRTSEPLSVVVVGPVEMRVKADDADWNSPKCDAVRSHDEADLCEQRKMAKAAIHTLWWTRLGIIVGALGTGFIIWNLVLVRRATSASLEANRIGLSAQRPWLRISDVGVVGPLQWRDDGYGQVEICFTVDNVGKSIARFVDYRAKTVVEGSTPLIHKQSYFDTYRNSGPGDATVVFPGGEPSKVSRTVVIDKTEVDRFRDASKWSGTPLPILPILLICVGYRGPLDDSSAMEHQTRVMAFLGKTFFKEDPALKEWLPGGIIPEDGEIAQQNLTIGGVRYWAD